MKQTTILLGLVFISRITLACSCHPYEPNFYNNVSTETYNCLAVFDTMDYSYEYNGLQGQTGYFILIDTIGEFNSNIGDTIIVTGQDGLNCGEILTGFSRGDTMFLALSDGFYETFEKDTFYLEGACGKYYLEISNGQNSGLSISEIKEKIKSETVGIDQPVLSDNLNIHPNPTGSFIKIISDNLLLREVKVFNMAGQMILDYDNIGELYFETDLSHITSGIYNIIVNTNKGLLYKKIVKK